MKTLNAIFSIAVIALCSGTAAFAEQNAASTVAVIAPASCEEVIITAQRPAAMPVLSAADRSALSASIKLETSKEIRQSMEQFLKQNSLKTALHNPETGVLQASL